MIYCGAYSCPKCLGDLKYYDSVKRIVKSKRGLIDYINIRRLVCITCKSIHRELPINLIPYKHYKRNIINGFIDGVLSKDDLNYEDYPCQLTINHWISMLKF